MNPTQLLFSFWLLLLPFYVVAVAGPYSLDNLVAPVLGVIGALSRMMSPRSADGGRTPWAVILLCGLYILLNVLPTVFAGTPDQFLSALRTELRVVLYFLIPILFIRSIEQFDRTLSLLTIGSIIVALSAIAAGVGLLHVGFRTPGTRFDIGVDRSLGLAATSGVFAAWTLVGLLGVMTAAHRRTRTILRHAVVRWAIYAILAAGVLAAQSRNVIMVAILAVVLFPVARWLGARRSDTIVHMVILLSPVLIVLLIVTPLLLNYVYEAFSTVGGEGTMVGRLEHYQVAWAVVVDHPFGLNGSLREKYEGLIDGTHDIWLGVLLKGGLPALFVLLVIFVRALIGPWKKLRHGVYAPQAAAMVVAALIMPVSGSFFVAQHNLIFWAFLSLPFAFHALTDQTETASRPARVPTPSRDAARVADVQRVGGYGTGQ